MKQNLKVRNWYEVVYSSWRRSKFLTYLLTSYGNVLVNSVHNRTQTFTVKKYLCGSTEYASLQSNITGIPIMWWAGKLFYLSNSQAKNDMTNKYKASIFQYESCKHKFHCINVLGLKVYNLSMKFILKLWHTWHCIAWRPGQNMYNGPLKIPEIQDLPSLIAHCKIRHADFSQETDWTFQWPATDHVLSGLKFSVSKPETWSFYI